MSVSYIADRYGWDVFPLTENSDIGKKPTERRQQQIFDRKGLSEMIKYAVKVTDEKRTWYRKDNGKISTVTEKTNEIPTDEEASFAFDEIRRFGLLDSARVMVGFDTGSR